MKAGVVRGPKLIGVEDVPVPPLEADGVLIKVKACGICGSDLHFFERGGRPGAANVLGHEFSGDVVAVGKNVKGVKQGDRVAAMSGRGCGQCDFCKKGQIVYCNKLALLGYGTPGAFAEYASVPFLNLGVYSAVLPAGLSYEEGATAEPLAVSLHAVTQVQPRQEDTCVVIGLGILGLCAVEILKSMGVKRVIASGRRSRRLQLAKAVGAELVVDAAKDDITAAVSEATAGRGADIVFDCAGTTDTFQQSLKMVHRGGKVDLVGLYQQPVTWNANSIISGDITLFGCGLRWDIPGALELMKNGKVKMKKYITHEFPLDRVKEAFDTQMTDKDAIKVLVKP